jgi:hypothetical protein
MSVYNIFSCLNISCASCNVWNAEQAPLPCASCWTSSATMCELLNKLRYHVQVSEQRSTMWELLNKSLLQSMSCWTNPLYHVWIAEHSTTTMWFAEQSSITLWDLLNKAILSCKNCWRSSATLRVSEQAPLQCELTNKAPILCGSC